MDTTDVREERTEELSSPGLEKKFNHSESEGDEENEQERRGVVDEVVAVDEQQESTNEASLINGLKSKLDLATNGHDHSNGDHDDNHHAISNGDTTNGMKNSTSNEFTYTSLGSVRDDESPGGVDSPPTTVTSHNETNGKELRIDSVELSLAKKVSSESSTTSLQQQIDEGIKRLPFDEIIDRVKSNKIANKDICNYVLNLLVGGEFDLEKNFVIKNVKSILLMIQVIKCARPALKAELWSLFTAILRKSQLNLQACVEIGLVETALHELDDADQICADLIVEMLTVLANYNITVDELKAVFFKLKGENQKWSKNSVKLLNVLKAMTYRYGPDDFFSLPGRKASGISLPPIRNWPYQNGFTFSTWIRIDPVSGVIIEKEKPYLYWFGTSKNVGYTAYFIGYSLVLSYKTKANGKEQQHCIQFEFKPREWYMITISHVYNRWSKNQVFCYVNGCLLSTVSIQSLYIDQADVFDKCFIGCTPDTNNELNLFSGQLSSFYLFNQALDNHVIEAMFSLGPSYKNQFRFENESAHLHLRPDMRKLLYDGRLTSAIVFLYNPVNCDSQLLLQSAPKQNQTQYFAHNAHALMLNDVRAVSTASIYSVLLSIGGMQVFYVLFGQLDYKQPDGETKDLSVCSLLIELICDMIEISYNVQIQMINTKGLLAISYYLEKSSREHVTIRVLNAIIKLIKFLVQLPNPNGTILLKQLLDHLIFNPAIWIYCSVEVQTKLYSFLATDFVNDLNIYINIRRISAVIQTIHALKYYYWVVDPTTRSGYEPKSIESLRPNRGTIVQLRAYMLLYLKELVTKESGVQQDELQALLNYLHTVNENDNLVDVLKLVVTLMNEHPPSMIPAFDAKHGIRTVLKLLGSDSETIRLQTLKLLGFFLQKSTFKRKAENMNTHNLYALISDRLVMNTPADMPFSLYNTLYDILVEKTINQVVDQPHPEPDATHHIENPLILKVITSLIRNSPAKSSKQTMLIKKQFLKDLIALCADSRDNRRTVLQMSVWQEFLIGLAYVYPIDQDEIEITDLVFKAFKILLHHAVKYEYGGWRVWIDTLSILHSRVSKEDYQLKASKLYDDYEKNKTSNSAESSESETTTTPEPAPSQDNANEDDKKKSDSRTPFQMPPFRIGEFKWSHMHKRLLGDMLESIEKEINLWKAENTIKALIDAANHTDNAIFCVNSIHIISQLADILNNACGGLLPLLASATTSNSSDIEIMENTEGMTNQEGMRFLERIMHITDIIILACNTSFGELEQEKNLPNGAIVRQALRLAFTFAVKNCLDFKRNPKPSTTSLADISQEAKMLATRDPVEVLLNLQLRGPENNNNPLNLPLGLDQGIGGKTRPECLLQNIDILRLKALLYRDVTRNDRNKNRPFVIVEDAKQSQFIALSIVYFISVLMVSRYRDIIEANNPTLGAASKELANRRSAADSASLNTNGGNDSMITESNLNHSQYLDSHSKNNESISGDENTTDTTSGVVSMSRHQKTHSNATSEFKEISLGGEQKQATAETNDDEDDEGAKPSSERINTISSNTASTSANQEDASNKYPNTPQKLPEYPKSDSADLNILRAANMAITEKLEKALTGVAPFLKDVFIEFSVILSRIIVGSHGQELISSGLSALRQSSSVIELVMLLCSQEWQTSLQKHAGLSFIELVNEGRLLAHASKDHIVRVANEADFILNRMRADDIKKHADFEQVSAQTSLERREEEIICEHLITAARKRDHYYAVKLRDKILNLITDKQGCWFNPKLDGRIYWKLDNWEDDMRRRRRLVKNPTGSSHSEAVLKSSHESHSLSSSDVLTNNAGDELIKQINNNPNSKRFLAAENMSNPASSAANSANTAEQLHISDVELEQEISGPIHFTTKCKLVCSVCVVSGTLSITSNELYFEVDETDVAFKKLDQTLLSYADNLHGKWHFNEIRAIFSRRFLLQNVAIELFVANRTSVMFAFNDRKTVEKVVNILPKVGVGPRYGLPQTRHTSLASPQQLFRSSNMTQKWQRREITNFEYLMYLNTIAGRTYNDLNQYFVFPWILVNYDSPTIDLNSPTAYRDLSKPIGALNPSRKQFFMERYQNWDQSTIPPFHYGTHYSTAAFTLNWLVRVEPFTSIFLNLQDGKFDHADRTFHSISTSWKNCQRDSSDVKELIPEFFYLPEMFLNKNDYNLGSTQDQIRVDDIELPAWAKNANEFVRINRQALESEFVSCQLHQWIDLIFGYKQRGPEAVRNCNVFYYLTYEGTVNLDAIDDPIMRQAVEDQIKNFGQTPSQLLNEPHPPRSSPLSISPMMFAQHNDDLSMIMKFLSNAPVIFVCANTAQPTFQTPLLAQTQFQPSVVTISSKHEFTVNKYNPAAAQPTQANAINNYSAYNESSAPSGPPSTPTTPSAGQSNTPASPNGTSSNGQSVINSQNFSHPISANHTPAQLQQNLPVMMDQLLAFNTALHKRQLGENFDDKLQLNQNNFIVTYDNKFLLATGFFDKSFRVFSTESAKIVQIIFGHYDLVTCISRSEMTQNGNCFVATGSRDSTIMIWIWNGSKGQIVNKDLSSPLTHENPSPGAILTGHARQIVGVVISSELGLVISASQHGPILVHTVYGDLLRQFDTTVSISKSEPAILTLEDPTLIYMLSDAESICAVYRHNQIAFYTINGTILAHTEVKDDMIYAVAMSQDGQYLVTGGEKGTVSIYRVHDLSVAYTYPTCDANIRSIAISHDQKFIIAGLSTGCLIVFNVNFNLLTHRRKSIAN